MRAVLALAVLLFGLALAAELGPRAREVETTRGADRALEVVVAARGRLLPAARPGTGREWIDCSMRIGDRTFPASEGFDGILFVRLDLAQDRAEVREFASNDPESARDLRRMIDTARASTLVALATQGDLSLLAGDDLEAALAALGSSTVLGRNGPESLALIALRTENGWVPLAQAHSLESGVVAAFVLGSDARRYADFRGDVIEVRDPKETALFLADQLAWARVVDADAVQRMEAVLSGRPMPSIRQAMGVPLVWEDVPVGQGSGFLGWVGLDPDQPGPLEFQVLVDGNLLTRRRVTPGAPWRSELVDLRAFAGRRVRLELRVEPPTDSEQLRENAGAGWWGRPMLVGGFERSPITAWAEAR